MSWLDGDFEVGKAMCDFLNKCFAKRSENLKYAKKKCLLKTRIYSDEVKKIIQETLKTRCLKSDKIITYTCLF